MTPADAKDWWLAAAALSSTLTAVPSARADTAAPPGEKAGVITGLKPDVRTAKGDRVLYVGSDMYRGEKLLTGPEGTLHILFMDQSSITLGPNSELTIDEFVYDPNAKKGKIGISLSAGLARVVGGQISKTNETTVKTASGTIGIRGGISTVQTDGQNTSGTFLFGQQMTVTDNDGNSTTVTRPGFQSQLSGNTPPTPPVRAPQEQLNSQLQQFASPPNPAPSPTGPSGPLPGSNSLVSTSDRPGQNGQPPANSLSSDRVSGQISTTLDNNPTNNGLPNSQEIAQNTLRNTLNQRPATTTS